MKTFTVNKTQYTEADIKIMSLAELQNLAAQIQSEIHTTAKRKQRLSTLPKSKKNMNTLKDVNYLSARLMDLQDACNYVSVYKKNARDNIVKDKEYFKTFYNLARENLRKGLFEQLVEKTKDTVGYSINY